MLKAALSVAFIALTSFAAQASTETWNENGVRLEGGIAPSEACRLIFIYARNGDRISFNTNSAMPSLTEKCNTARSHEFGLSEDDCRATQFLLDMVHQEVPELTCKS
jgi:hypothetical protein